MIVVMYGRVYLRLNIMFTKPKDTCSLALASKLKDLGRKKQCYFVRVVSSPHSRHLPLMPVPLTFPWCTYEWVVENEKWEAYYMPTVAEMMDVLPWLIEISWDMAHIDINKEDSISNYDIWYSYWDYGFYYNNKHFPDSVAELLIWVIENKHIDISKII